MFKDVPCKEMFWVMLLLFEISSDFFPVAVLGCPADWSSVAAISSQVLSYTGLLHFQSWKCRRSSSMEVVGES
jgi:hypothetical protein